MLSTSTRWTGHGLLGPVLQALHSMRWIDSGSSMSKTSFPVLPVVGGGLRSAGGGGVGGTGADVKHFSTQRYPARMIPTGGDGQE